MPDTFTKLIVHLIFILAAVGCIYMVIEFGIDLIKSILTHIKKR